MCVPFATTDLALPDLKAFTHKTNMLIKIYQTTVTVLYLCIYVTYFAKTCQLCTPCQRTVFTING